MGDNTPGRLIMVAPNGARRTRKDHPALPVTIAEIVETARSCRQAGADAIHAHVRDENGRHVLDAGLYGELISELQKEVPDLLVQITSEAVGKYSPEEQSAVVRDAMPGAVSVALREMMPEGGDEQTGRDFYAYTGEAGIAVQHILYAPEDIARLAFLINHGRIPGGQHALLFVLGRYTEGQVSSASDLLPFLSAFSESGLTDRSSRMVCAFGPGETAALATAFALGGHARVGFENNLAHADGRIAADNAERVSALNVLRAQLGFKATADGQAIGLNGR